MMIKVLGSAGSEAPGHDSPAFLVDGKLLLDAGTVAKALNIREERDLRCILLTHAHLDHVKGIPFLLDNRASRGSGTAITVMSGKEVLADLRRHVFNGRIWPDFTKIPSASRPALRYRALTTARSCRVEGYRVAMVRVSHAVAAYGYVVEDRDGASVAYTGDTGPTVRFWKRMASHDVKALITEASFPNRLEKLALASGHLTPNLLGREIAKMSPPPAKIYVMHLKPRFEREIEAEIRALGLDNVGFLRGGEGIRI